MKPVTTAQSGIRPAVLSEIRAIARKYRVERVILFGSRARGDFRRTSDIDLAVSGGQFAAFALEVDEETSTLLRFDFVNLDSPVQPELLRTIETEGRLLYEQNGSEV